MPPNFELHSSVHVRSKPGQILPARHPLLLLRCLKILEQTEKACFWQAKPGFETLQGSFSQIQIQDGECIKMLQAIFESFSSIRRFWDKKFRSVDTMVRKLGNLFPKVINKQESGLTSKRTFGKFV